MHVVRVRLARCPDTKPLPQRASVCAGGQRLSGKRGSGVVVGVGGGELAKKGLVLLGGLEGDCLGRAGCFR